MAKMKREVTLLLAGVVLTVISAAAQEKSKIIEQVVARVNNDIITQSDLDKARAQMGDEVRQDCPKCTPEQLQQQLAEGQKNLLRDLIDNSLLVQRGKDMGVDVQADVVKRLDEIRQQNKIDSMEDLEKRVEEQGIDYQDFKKNIEDQLIQQEVIRQEVGSKIIVDHTEALKYYDEHKDDFVLPETVVLREIFINTEGKPETDLPALKKKAEGLLQRIKDGDDFEELAKRYSDGSTAKEGGDLGTFKPGELGAAIEAEVFKLNANQVTGVLQVKTGYEILQVLQHYAAGLQPEDKVDTQIVNRLYDEKMRPALREYLDTLRQDSYVEVKPGYQDTSAATGTAIEEVPVTPDDDETKAKKSGHRLLPFGKKTAGT